MLTARENDLGVSHIITVAAGEILEGDGERRKDAQCRVDWGEAKRQKGNRVLKGESKRHCCCC